MKKSVIKINVMVSIAVMAFSATAAQAAVVSSCDANPYSLACKLQHQQQRQQEYNNCISNCNNLAAQGNSKCVQHFPDAASQQKCTQDGNPGYYLDIYDSQNYGPDITTIRDHGKVSVGNAWGQCTKICVAFGNAPYNP